MQEVPDAHGDITVHLNKARGAFSRLRNIWKSKQYRLKTKIRLYNSNVEAALLCGSKYWRCLHYGGLHRICNINWLDKITNEEPFKKTDGMNMSLKIKNRRL